MGSFQNSIQQFTIRKKADRDVVVRKILFDLSALVLERSPVDTGRFRANWQYGYGIKPVGDLDEEDTSPDGQSTVDAIIGNVGKGIGIHYLVNNLPYARVIEYGEYGDGPKTTGGYSKQAPQGVVRISMIELVNELNSDMVQES